MRRWPISAALLGLLLPALAQAAPFCVQVRGMTPECGYYDAVQCRRRAAELSGVCIGNADELMIQPGSGKFCSVDSSRYVQCIYADRTSCEQEALRSGSVCLDSTPQSVQQDPYRNDPNRRY